MLIFAEANLADGGSTTKFRDKKLSKTNNNPKYPSYLLRQRFRAKEKHSLNDNGTRVKIQVIYRNRECLTLTFAPEIDLKKIKVSERLAITTTTQL